MRSENYKIPKKLVRTKYRKVMWKNTEEIFKKLEEIIPISEAYILGSFTTKKRRLADVDFIVLINVDNKNYDKKERWCLDLVISPDNNYGNQVLEDAQKWMKQKYGSKNYMFVKLK